MNACRDGSDRRLLETGVACAGRTVRAAAGQPSPCAQRPILKALIAGETDPERLLAHTTGKLKTPRPRLLEGLRGAVTHHHRFMLKLHLRQIDALETGIGQLERQMEKLLRPFRERVEQLITVPGVSHTVAQVLIAEIGLDMTRFPTAGHLVALTFMT